MNKTTQIFIGIGVLLVGCAVAWYFFVSVPKIQNTQTSNTEKDSDVVFEKKLGCGQLMSDLEKRYTDKGDIFVEIFYSPKADACLYVTESRYKTKHLKMNFQNALTNETLKFDIFSYQCSKEDGICDINNLTLKQIKNNEREDLRLKEFQDFIDGYR